MDLFVLPTELLRVVLSELGPKALLRFGATCRAAAVAASLDALWAELVRHAWQDAGSSCETGRAREFFRQMRQPPAIMKRGPKAPAECAFAVALSDSSHSLGDYRLLLEVIDEDGRSVLTKSLQAFEGMVSHPECYFPAGETALIQTAGAGPGLRTVKEHSARLCVDLGGECVCLGVVSGSIFAHPTSRRDLRSCYMRFYWRMPARTVPGDILDYIHAGPSRSSDVMRLQCIETSLFVGLEGAGNEWRPYGSRLEAAPLFVHPRQGPGYHPLLPISNRTVKERCRTDAMALCFLHEAMRMRD